MDLKKAPTSRFRSSSESVEQVSYISFIHPAVVASHRASVVDRIHGIYLSPAFCRPTGKLTGAALFAASEWSVWLAVISLEVSPNLCISCLRVDRRSRCGAEQRSACSDSDCATTNAAHLHAVNRSRKPLGNAANRPAS